MRNSETTAAGSAPELFKYATPRRRRIPDEFPAGWTSRVVLTKVREDPCEISVRTPDAMFNYWEQVVAAAPDYESEKESLVVVMLDGRLRPFSWHRVSLGSVNECSCHPREIFRPVIVSAAFGFVLMHNHPSGDPSPSRADERLTRTVLAAAEIVSIFFLDHVIVGQHRPGRAPYYSFSESGIIP